MNLTSIVKTAIYISFEKISRCTGLCITEYKEAENGHSVDVTMSPPLTQEMQREGVRPVIMFHARFMYENWEIWSTNKLEGMKIIGEIVPKRHLLYRYIIGIPT